MTESTLNEFQVKAHSQTTSVVICAYTVDRWDDLCAAVESVCRQTCRPNEILVVIDHNEELLELAQGHFSDVLVIANDGEAGLSGARNAGICRSVGEIIAFIDDDAVAEPDWLEWLLAPFKDTNVIAVGGTIEPTWAERSPRWFPNEFQWVVGCSYEGLPRHRAQVRNVIGANMAFCRRVFEEAGLFRNGMGRIGTKPLGCEETELCIRARQRWPNAQIIFEPRAMVSHRVPLSRATWRYFRNRCFSEGRSKALVSQFAGAGDGLQSERAYTFSTLPKGMLRGAAETLKGEPSGIVRSLTIGLGLGITTFGYLAGLCGERVPNMRLTSSKPVDAVSKFPYSFLYSKGTGRS